MRWDPRPDGIPRNIVEMGPGTGAVTRCIATAMRAGDRLDAYEISAEFTRYLERAVATDSAYARARDRIRIHCSPAEQAAPGGAVDFVICSIPLNNLPPVAVRRIFATGFEMLQDRGWFTYFEYPCLPRLRRLLAGPEERLRIDSVREIKAAHRHPSTRTRLVLLNMPPARAVHVPGTHG